MKKLFLLFASFITLLFIGCEKEDPQSDTNDDLNVSSNVNDYGMEYMKELTVQDESGKNTLFLAIYSDDNETLDEFLANNQFTLSLNATNEDLLKSNIKSNKVFDDNNKNFNINEPPKVFVELITANIESNIKTYSLNISLKQLKSTSFLFGYPVGYTTSNDFIGAVHRGWGYEFVAKLEYKTHWYSSWKYYEEDDGTNAWFIYPDGSYYIALGEYWDLYKRGIVIYPHLYQSSINYRIALIKDNFRGHDCTIGSYDTENCYVGTPPSGTTAFVWPNPSGAFYYSPLPGNYCPIGYFDGANCKYRDIPSTCYGFIYHNNFYVRSDIIPTI